MKSVRLNRSTPPKGSTSSAVGPLPAGVAAHTDRRNGLIRSHDSIGSSVSPSTLCLHLSMRSFLAFVTQYSSLAH
eukprot:6191886-Amphidinium_carterae.1